MAKPSGRGAATPKRDRAAARRARAAARGAGAPPSGPRTPTQDAANAWRQGVSAATAATVDELTAHVQAVALDQLERFGSFPAFLVTARRDGEFELDSVEPPEDTDADVAGSGDADIDADHAGRGDADAEAGAGAEDALHRAQDPETALRTLAGHRAAGLLGAALALPASLPDRSGAAALVIEVEHRDGVSLTMVQSFRVAGRDGARATSLDDPVVEARTPSLLRPVR